jgi:DNA polymerase-3 subunit epsilon
MAMPQGPETIGRFLNARSREATLPPHLPRESFERLPEAPGVYYFRGHAGDILYVGKAINLKKRVLGHFYDTSEREMRLCRETAGIDFEHSGSEFLALLMESAAIKKHYPAFNRAQKGGRPSFGLFAYTDQAGVRNLAINRVRKGQQSLKVFYSQADARLFLEQLCAEYRLCARYCHLQPGASHCGHFRVPSCDGVCRGLETPAGYNLKVGQALEALNRSASGHVLIRERGRSPDEQALVWIENGTYRGFGFLPAEASLHGPEDLEAAINPQHAYPDTARILQAYLLKNPDRYTEIPVAEGRD